MSVFRGHLPCQWRNELFWYRAWSVLFFLPIAVASIIDALAFQAAFIPRSWGEFWFPVLLRLVGNVLGVGIGAGLAFGFDLGESGIACGYLAAVALSTLFLGVNCYRG